MIAQKNKKENPDKADNASNGVLVNRPDFRQALFFVRTVRVLPLS